MLHSKTIKALLLEGKTYSEIQKVTNCNKSTISYHAKKLGMGKELGYNKILLNEICVDWDDIEKKLLVGISKKDVAKEHNITQYTLNKAIKEKIIQYTPKNKPYNIEEYLVNDGPYIPSSKLKKKLYKEKLKFPKCEMCGQGTCWNDKELTLQLDHIDGNSYNNRLENLRILCPNCHSQTKTYAGKNILNSNHRTKKYYNLKN